MSLKLTQAVINGAQENHEAGKQLYDTEVSGLRVVIGRKSSSYKLVTDQWSNGRKIRSLSVTIGRTNEISLKEARDLAIEKKIAIRRGENPNHRPITGMTLIEAWHDFERISVSSFIAEANKRDPEVPSVECVSVTQTASEKFVALTRRGIAESDVKIEDRDQTLVRHIYDLHVIKTHYDLEEVAVLAADIMPHDAEIFGHKHEAYRENPLKQTRLAIELLEKDPYYRGTYAAFARDMIYGPVPTYDEALMSLRDIAAALP